MRHIDKFKIIEEVARLHEAGADVELLLVLMKEKGLDQIDSMKALMRVMGLSLTDAKCMVDGSTAWSGQKERVQAAREAALKALKELSKESSIRIDIDEG